MSDSQTKFLRPELPTLPSRIAKLPIHRGYPVPFFVQWIDGVPDFRIMDRNRLVQCVRFRCCWVCGETLGAFLAFTVGPMCAVNRISAEPPSHRECAEFSARACPFLTRPHMHRREFTGPQQAQSPGGMMIERNPGVALVWTTKRYTVIHPDRTKSPLFQMGNPLTVECFAEGRPATRDEIRASVESGLPILRAAAEEEGAQSVAALDREIEAARKLLGVAA